MEEQICEQFTHAIDILEETYCLCDKDLISKAITEVKDILLLTRSELKDDVYYANLICKELYCKIRDDRDCAYELLCCAEKVLDDQGGVVDPYCFSEVDELIREAICYLEKAKSLLCDSCKDKDSCESLCESSCESLCESSCESFCESLCESLCESSCESLCESSCSGLYQSCGSSSYCDSSSMNSSCLSSC